MTTKSASLSTVTPYLMVSDTLRAIDYYQHAFGATELIRPPVAPGGKVVHAQIRIFDSPVMLADESPQWANRSPQSLGGAGMHLHVYVDDVDQVVRRAAEAGAKIVIEVNDQFYGDRCGRLVDPFGHTWIIATRKESLTADEMQRRLESSFKA